MESGPEVALRGQGVRQKLFVILALAGVIPLLSAVYLVLPLVSPRVAGSGYYPRDPIFFWVLLFFLALLELLALYIAVDLARGVAAVAGLLGPGATPRPAGARTDEVGLLMREVSGLLDRVQLQADQVREYGARIGDLETQLHVARDRLREAVLQDGLTGLGNRRQFERRLHEEVQRGLRFGRPLSVLALELSGFTGFRDRHGDTDADGLLKQVAGVVRAACRSADVPCRVGEGLFALLLPETPKGGALAVAARLRAAVADGVRLSPGIPAVRVGAVALPDDGATGRELLDRLAEAVPGLPREPERPVPGAPETPGEAGP